MLELQIEGMTCQSCVKSIEQAVSGLEGVTFVSVDLYQKKGTIIGGNEKDIKQAIEDCGFECRPFAGAVSPEVPAEVKKPSPKPDSTSENIELRDFKGKEIKVKVKGMTCASCVNSIESYLIQQKGISSVVVSLHMEEATVISTLHESEIIEMINDMGFEASAIVQTTMQKIMIHGMTCASCSGGIEREISQLEGVESISVNLLGQFGTVKINKKLIGIRDVIERIEDMGFTAYIQDSENSQVESLERAKEIIYYRESFWSSFRYTVVILFCSMVLPVVAPSVANYQILLPGLVLKDVIMCICTIPVQFFIGRHFYDKAFRAISHGSYTMDVLVTLGTTLSFTFSIVSMFNSIVRNGNPLPQVFFETSANLITFVTLGRYLENIAKSKTSSALTNLIKLTPSHTTLMENDQEKKIPSEFIKQGDLLKIMPGERFPCDGIIEFGTTCVDESVVTGEPLPIEKAVGDVVIAGSVNGNGCVHILATRVGDDSTLSQIVKLVSEAQASKAPIQAVADKLAGIFVPSVVALGFLTFLGWFAIIELFGFIPNHFPQDSNHLFVCLSFCISVIVVACPCALGLATPTAVMVGTGVGAKMGILIKGGEPLEMAGKIKKIVFDKTGTLTVGVMSVHTFDILNNIDRKVLLDLVGTVESMSEHPIGKSISDFVNTQVKCESTIVSVQSVPGSGIYSQVKNNGKVYNMILGNLKFVLENGCVGPNLEAVELLHEKNGRTVIYVGVEKEISALIALSDTIKPESRQVIAGLKKLGIKVAMVTGDQETTAKQIAAIVGIDEVHAGVSPAGKQAIIKTMQEKDFVAMVGDGVNDSASLAQSNMGIAVFGGSDVAVSAASVVLMRNDLRDVLTAIDLSKTIFRRIYINFIFATIYNVAIIPVAMGIFSPWGVLLPSMVSAMAMSVSSLTVVLSSLHLEWYKRPVFNTSGEIDKSNQFSDPGSESIIDDIIANSIKKLRELPKKGYNRLHDEELAF